MPNHRLLDPRNPHLKLERAIRFAARVHGEQADAAGRPFLGHPLRVMAYAAESGLSGDEIIAAVLHDSVEDTETTLDEIEENFGYTVRVLVDALTRRHEETYQNYLERIREAGFIARMIKLADLRDNMDRRRMAAFGTFHQKNLVETRYKPAKAFLEEGLE